jgi:hypothetical protein
MTTHEVLRPIGGTPHQRGETVDASGWRNVGTLETQGYLRSLATETTTYQVVRPIPAGDRTYQPGETVDASGWRNAASLVATGALTPITPSSPSAMTDEAETKAPTRRRTQRGEP